MPRAEAAQIVFCALAALLLVAAAGCAGLGNAHTTPKPGTQSISVRESPGHCSGGGRWATYANLSDARQQAFTRALQNGSLTYGRDETPPFDFHDQTRPAYVRYDHTCYFVQVAIV